MVGWSHCLALTTLGLASRATVTHAFVPPVQHRSLEVTRPQTQAPSPTLHDHHHHHSSSSSIHHHHGCPCPSCTSTTTSNSAQRRADTLVLLARGRRGRGGGGWARRRRQDANPVEFDKYGFPIPPKKSAKELEEEHKKWMESMEESEENGEFPLFDAGKEGFTAEEVENDPLADPAAAFAAAEAATAAAAAAVVSGEGTGGGAEDEPDWDNIPEYGGEFLGMDDPLNAPWRVKGEEIIRAAVSEVGFETYDVTWHLHHLNIDIVRGGGEDAGSLSSDEMVDVTRAIEEALMPHDRELKIMQRFHLCVGTPGAKDVLTTEREFQAFKGYEVNVILKSPVNESQVQNMRVGRLLERNPLHTILNVKGKNVTIPTGMIHEIRLPEAMREEDDFEVLEENWANLFVDGKVPTTLHCEYEMPGLVSFGKGVKMVEPEYYVPPPTEEEEDEEGEGDEDEEGFEEEDE